MQNFLDKYKDAPCLKEKKHMSSATKATFYLEKKALPRPFSLIYVVILAKR